MISLRGNSEQIEVQMNKDMVVRVFFKVELISLKMFLFENRRDLYVSTKRTMCLSIDIVIPKSICTKFILPLTITSQLLAHL